MNINSIKNWIVSLVIVATAGGAFFVAATPQLVFADDGNCSNNDSGFLGLPTWYRGLQSGSGSSCKITVPPGNDGLSKFVWTIGLNILDIILTLVGYISVGFVLWGGFLLMTGRGKPAEIAEGQITVRNAVIGLVISFGAVVVVRFVAEHILTGSTGVFGLPNGSATTTVTNVLGLVYMAAGITAVITIVIAGYMYTISGGNAAEVEKSKNAILYAVIGLIIIGFAFTITQFVIGRF